MNTTKEQVFQFPASKDQERLWILSKFKQVKGAYNMPGLIHVKGNLNLEIFKACITDLLVRHEPLRTSFTIVNDQLFQLINEVVECDLPIIKINDSESLNTFIQNKIHSSLDLQYDKLFNVYVIDKGDFEYSILVLLHHAIADGWSLNVLLRDLSTLYTLRLEKAEVLTLPELEIQFMDVVGSEIEFASTIHYDNQLNFWKAYLEGIPELLDLPTVNLRKRIQSYEGKTFEFTLEPNLVNRLKEISSQENTSLFVTLLAAFKILLTKYSNQDDITVGILHANREHQAIQDIIGFFVKTLPIRTKLTNDSTFRKVINNISRDFTSILKHKDISFYDIANATNTSRVSSHNPIFQVLFSYENIPNVELKLGNLSTTVERLSGFYSKFDLALDVKDKGDQNLVFSFEYNIDLFNETFIEQLKEGFIAILNKISLEPTKKIIDIDALSNTERNTILNEWNNTSRNYDTYNSLIDLFKENVNRFPNQIASVYGNHSLTYKELDNLSDVYANYLFNKGIRKSDFVCLVFERNEKLLPVLLAIMKTGATYIPIDPSYPKDRVSYIVNHSESKYIITHKSLKLHTHSLNVKVPSIFIDECVEDENTYFTQADFQPIKKDSIAYCIYTSGSTGLPKGVEISHKALVNFLLTMKERPGMKTGESILAVTSISFDISGLELYLPLISGGTTIVCPYESIINPEKLVETINRHNPSLMQATPSLFKLLKSVNWQGKKEMKIFCGGESFPKELAEWLKVRCDSVWNMYGPTETTIWSLTHEFEDVINDVPIGRPIANTQIFILDQYLKPIPIGVIGDLYIGGNGLATSYYKDPEQTDTKFINWQCDGHSSRIYKTGDRAKYDTLGNVYFMGRKDFQVKLNGHRIELEEIEAVLNQIDFIKQTVVLVDKFGEDNQHLIAYLETNELSVDIGKIRSIISTKLPAYMVPAKFIAIKKFPLTANGKIDRKNIHTEKNFELLIERKDIEKPLTETEDILLKIWEKVLNIKPIGITDDFLSLGGSSISSVKITSLASAKGVIISPEMLFEYPTIKELALASSNTTDINIGADITAQQEELSLLDSFSDFRTDSGDKFKYDIIKRNMVIESIGKYIPEIELSSTDIVNSCLNKIRFPMQHITGIESIRKLPKEKDSISLAISAVENCLTSSKYNPLDIDLVISCGIFRLDSNNGIQIDPSFSHQIKHHFGMSNAQNFDISNACAGLFTGLIVAESFLRNNTAKRCMIFSSEYLTHITETAQLEVESISDKKIAGLTAGDAGLAMIVELGDNGDIGFQDLHLFTMGEYSDLCIIKPTERSHGGFIINTDAIKMGEAGYVEAARHALFTLEKNKWGFDFDHFIMHQASSTTILNATKEINKFFSREILNDKNIIDNIKNRGNTASTTYFLATIDNILNGRINSNNKVIYSVSGSGLNLGTALYKFDDLPDRLRNGNVQKIQKENGTPKKEIINNKTRVEIKGMDIILDKSNNISGMKMLYGATEKTLKNFNGLKEEIDLLIYYGTLRDDYIYEPAIASFLSGKTGINSTKELVRKGKSTFAFDVYNGGLGFLCSCQVASEMIKSGRSHIAVVASSEIDVNKQYNLPPLGIVEAGTSLILSKSESGQKGFGNFEYHTIRHASNQELKNSFYTEWKENKLYAIKVPSCEIKADDFVAIEKTINELLNKENLIISDLDYVICSKKIDKNFPSWIQDKDILLNHFEWPLEELYNLSLPLQIHSLIKSNLLKEDKRGLFLDIINVPNGFELICSIYYS